MAAAEIGTKLNLTMNAGTPFARQEPALHIVKYRQGQEGPETEKQFNGSAGEAEQFAINLVRSGEALPDNIAIYQNTGIVVQVRCDYPPQAAQVR